jgi:K+-sensing histidine kinase KdpD
MRQIADAALAINAILPVDEVLRLVVDQARSIIGAHQGVVNLVENGNWAESLMETSFSDKYAEWRDYDVTPDGSGIYALVCRHNQSMRLTQDDVIAHPAWRGFGSEAGSHPPMRGWLAAPLIGRDGRNLGVIQLSDKEQGDFTPKDEAILLQLAQVASIAVENARLYAEEARARLAAEDANRVKVRFLAMISHELRTPLTSIKGFASTLLSDDVQWEPAAQQEFIRIIDLETDKLTELVSELLDLSRMQVGTFSIAPERCTLEEIIAGVQAELNALAGDHPLRLIIPPGLPPVQADARRIAQVLANLVSNAAKYSPPQTPITLRAQQLDSFVQIDIRDLGSGVPPENRERVFEPFQQVEQRAEGKSNGVGLGLAICKGVVEAHGGNIWISDGAPGAIVSFTLPLTEQVGAIKRDAP